MRLVVQRVRSARLCVAGEEVSRIGRGLVVYFGVKAGDTEAQAEACAAKIAALRVFSDEAGKLNLSVRDVGGEVLLVSQFTLYGSAARGNRPSFTEAERPDRAEALYRHAAEALRELSVPVRLGVFGADMQIAQENDGPVTILFESEKKP